jgi:hypothetical protein
MSVGISENCGAIGGETRPLPPEGKMVCADCAYNLEADPEFVTPAKW